jgi:Ca2+-binding EF-hand superfamily protein
MSKLLFGGAAAILAATAAFAQAPAPQVAPGQPARLAKPMTRADVQSHVQRMFARFDANRDGFITQDEVAAAKAQFAARARSRAGKFDPAKRFDRIDANHDGMISRQEFAAAPRGPQFGARMAGMRAGFGANLFERADVNHDGRVSLAEAQQLALQHFDRADLNHDGTITPEERRQARQLRRAERHPA